MKKRNLFLAVIISLISLHSLYTLFYVYNDVMLSADIPFLLPTTSVLMQKSTDTGEASVDALTPFLPKTDIVLFSLDKEARMGAIYDPSLSYSNVPVVAYTYTRYFAPSDFDNDAISAGVRMLHIDYDFEMIANCSIKGQSKKYDAFEELLFCITRDERLYNKDIDYVINLNAMDTLGDTIYFYSENTTTLKTVIQQLESLGYVKVPLYNWQTFSNIMAAIIKPALIPRVVALSILIFMYIMAVISIHLSSKKEQQAHRIVGGRPLSIYYFTHFKGVVYSVLLMPLTYLLFIFLANIYSAYMDYGASLVFLVLMTLFMLLVHFLGYMFIKPYQAGGK